MFPELEQETLLDRFIKGEKWIKNTLMWKMILQRYILNTARKNLLLSVIFQLLVKETTFKDSAGKDKFLNQFLSFFLQFTVWYVKKKEDFFRLEKDYSFARNKRFSARNLLILWIK